MRGKPVLTLAKIVVHTATLAGLALTLACSQPPAPTPAPALPTLQRPRLALSVPTQGNVWVPKAALVERSGIPGVFVLENELARFRMVRVGRRDGARLEVLAGLIGNESLVLGDLAAVRDGSPIAGGG